MYKRNLQNTLLLEEIRLNITETKKIGLRSSLSSRGCGRDLK